MMLKRMLFAMAEHQRQRIKEERERRAALEAKMAKPAPPCFRPLRRKKVPPPPSQPAEAAPRFVQGRPGRLQVLRENIVGHVIICGIGQPELYERHFGSDFEKRAFGSTSVAAILALATSRNITITARPFDTASKVAVDELAKFRPAGTTTVVFPGGGNWPDDFSIAYIEGRRVELADGDNLAALINARLAFWAHASDLLIRPAWAEAAALAARRAA